jgi:mannose-6-phosphate isomerase-like protein (cupin superfamily)
VTGDSAPVTLSEKLKLIADHWHPRIVARVDGYHVKLVKVKGEFVWHAHADQDEMFLVIEGDIVIRMHDGDVSLSAGDLFVVPKGAEHCPFAEDEASLLVLARADTDQTGGVPSALRAEGQEWI